MSNKRKQKFCLESLLDMKAQRMAQSRKEELIPEEGTDSLADRLGRLEQSQRQVLFNQALMLQNQAEILNKLEQVFGNNSQMESEAITGEQSISGSASHSPSPEPTLLNSSVSTDFREVPLDRYLSESQLESILSRVSSRTQLAVRLFRAVFRNSDELRGRNVNGLQNRGQLCPDRIRWIRRVILEKIPPDEAIGETEEEDWKRCVQNIDAFKRGVEKNLSRGRRYRYDQKRLLLVLEA